MKLSSQVSNGLAPGLTPRQRALLSLVPLICLRSSISRFETTMKSAFENGLLPSEIKEVLIQLTIYAGFPKVLEAITKFKDALSSLGLTLDRQAIDSFSELEEANTRNGNFNFFKLPEVHQALNAIDEDFAYFALNNAIELNDRVKLSAQERALLILASDICNHVFEGPFQIHLSMAIKSGVHSLEIDEMIFMLTQHSETRQSAAVATAMIGHGNEIISSSTILAM
jgi:4-carboxymuconolactone decarboxylase